MDQPELAPGALLTQTTPATFTWLVTFARPKKKTGYIPLR